MEHSDEEPSFSELNQTEDRSQTLEKEEFTPVDTSNPNNLIPEATEKDMSTADYMVAFSGRAKKYCVGTVNMSGSTMITTSLHRTKIMKYFEIFLNSMDRARPND